MCCVNSAKAYLVGHCTHMPLAKFCPKPDSFKFYNYNKFYEKYQSPKITTWKRLTGNSKKNLKNKQTASGSCCSQHNLK